MFLSEKISISRQFLRSVRVDLDWGNKAALHGYICQPSAQAAIESMCRQYSENDQAAFTWTGPYGGGKSSLALALANLLGGDKEMRALAAGVLGQELAGTIKDAFKIKARATPWVVIPVVGRRANPIDDIAEAIRNSGIPYVGRRLGDAPDGRRIIKVLTDLAEVDEQSGVLLLIDELGKFLEYAAVQGGDIHFFQELAEAASRCKGNILVVGVLHQSFEQYASRLGKEARDEWAKIQGRFSDIPLISATDEIVQLTSRAVQCDGVSHPYSMEWSEVIASTIRGNRPAAPVNLNQLLDNCWPLHPVVVSVLGQVSKRRFSQNERSTFGFLASAESKGFMEYLKTTPASSGSVYGPARYWDYLRENMETAILASQDGHRWAQSLDAIERCSAKGRDLHLSLIKTIALIDLFRNGSGLTASREVLGTCVLGVPMKELDAALSDMASWSQIIYRKHLNSWAIYQGSDFDIDAALAAALSGMPGLDVDRLNGLANLQPILPKRHYQETGALRWFDVELCALDDIAHSTKMKIARDGAAGKFLLAIPTNGESHRIVRELCSSASLEGDAALIYGVPGNAESIWSLGREFLALEGIQESRSELNGDSVARIELNGRIISVLGKLQDALTDALNNAQWSSGGELISFNRHIGLSDLASKKADDLYPKSLKIQSELVNRQTVSSNTKASLNILAAAMHAAGTREALGFEGFPPERGIYATTLGALQLHVEKSPGVWGFIRPTSDKHAGELVALWDAADELLSQSEVAVSLQEIFKLWEASPFGLRKGLHGIIGIAYVLSNEAKIAAYLEGVFLPELTSIFFHEAIRDPSCIKLRNIKYDAKKKKYLNELSDIVAEQVGQYCEPDPLSISRALVGFCFALPGWTKRTSKLSSEAKRLRDLLLHAEDPHKLIFKDLSQLYDASKASLNVLNGVARDISELKALYPGLVSSNKTALLRNLDMEEAELDAIHERAASIKGLSGDYKLDAFATRLQAFDGTDDSMESLMSLASGLPTSEWTDAQVAACEVSLLELSLKFRQSEVFATVKGRSQARVAIGLMFGAGSTSKTHIKSIDITLDEQKFASKLSKQILSLRSDGDRGERILLAALAEVGAVLCEKEGS